MASNSKKSPDHWQTTIVEDLAGTAVLLPPGYELYVIAEGGCIDFRLAHDEGETMRIIENVPCATDREPFAEVWIRLVNLARQREGLGLVQWPFPFQESPR